MKYILTLLLGITMALTSQAQKKTYEYDDVQRLTKVNVWAGTSIAHSIVYTYDELGNRTSKVVTTGSCQTATATLTGTQSITSGQTATLIVNFTGAMPYSFVFNGQTYPNINAPSYTLTVSPSQTTTYTLTNVSNTCGTGSVSGEAIVTVNTPCGVSTPIITATPSVIIAGQNSVLSVTNCGGIVTWGNNLGIGNSKTVSPSSNTTYTATCTIGTCVSQSGNYTLNVNNSGCNLKLEGFVSSTNCGQNTGSIALIGWGGTSPYTYTWSNATTGYLTSNLAAGVYSVRVQDAVGCIKDSSFTVSSKTFQLADSIGISHQFYDQALINNKVLTWQTSNNGSYNLNSGSAIVLREINLATNTAQNVTLQGISNNYPYYQFIDIAENPATNSFSMIVNLLSSAGTHKTLLLNIDFSYNVTSQFVLEESTTTNVSNISCSNLIQKGNNVFMTNFFTSSIESYSRSTGAKVSSQSFAYPNQNRYSLVAGAGNIIYTYGQNVDRNKVYAIPIDNNGILQTPVIINTSLYEVQTVTEFQSKLYVFGRDLVNGLSLGRIKVYDMNGYQELASYNTGQNYAFSGIVGQIDGNTMVYISNKGITKTNIQSNVFKSEVFSKSLGSPTLYWNNGSFVLTNMINNYVIKGINSSISTPTIPTITINSGQEATLMASGCTGTVTWFAAATGGNSLWTGANYTTPALTTSTNYYAECSTNSCPSSNRGMGIVMVSTLTSLNNPLLVSPLDVSTLPYTTTINLQWSANGNATGTNYYPKLRDLTTGLLVFDYTNVGSATSYTATVVPGHNYRWVVQARRTGYADGNSQEFTFSVQAASYNLELGSCIVATPNPLVQEQNKSFAYSVKNTGNANFVGTIKLTINRPNGTTDVVDERLNITITPNQTVSYSTAPNNLTSTTNPVGTNYQFAVVAFINGTGGGVAVNSISGCSNPLITSVIANPNCVAPTVSSTTINSGQTATLTATGCTGTVNWFSVATGGTSLGSGMSFTTPTLTTNTTYHAECVINGCTSTTRGAGTVTVNAVSNFCPQTITHTSIVSTGIYAAGQNISSATNVPTNTTYLAGNSILLLPGFSAGANENFKAQIQGCASIPTNGLVAYYPFTGNANDMSGNANNGTVSGAVLANDRFGAANKAYKFVDGSRINVPNSSSLNLLNAFTFNVWVNMVSTTGRDGNGTITTNSEQCIFTKNCDGGHLRTAIYPQSNGTFLLQSYANNGDEIAIPFQINQWKMISIVYDGSTLKQFVNGNLISTKTTTLNLAVTNANDLVIGNMGCYIYHFNGFIDDFRMYNRGLSNTEILNIYNVEK